MEFNGHVHASAALPAGKVSAVTIEYLTGWISEPVLAWWRQTDVPARNRTPVVQSAAIHFSDWSIPALLVIILHRCKLKLNSITSLWFRHQHKILTTFFKYFGHETWQTRLALNSFGSWNINTNCSLCETSHTLLRSLLHCKFSDIS